MTNPRKKILVGTPMYGGKCYGVFTESLLKLQHLLLSKGYHIAFEYIVNESLITRARNEIVHTFMSKDFDYLLFIDGDHRFDPLGVLKMIEEDVDFICGIAPNKKFNWESLRSAAKFGASNLEFFTGNFVFHPFEDFRISDLNEKLEIKHGGTGLMLVKRNVFDKIKSQQNVYQSEYGPHKVVEYFKTSVENGMLLSEDYELCKQWREVGGKVYAAPWVEITHVGTYEFMGSLRALLDLEKRKAELSSKKS